MDLNTFNMYAQSSVFRFRFVSSLRKKSSELGHGLHYRLMHSMLLFFILNV